ncbi:GNAT family N-acetyltransferase [Rhodocytophaga rosea]|uniref:GNAT family N-acetyltransferase n=1 Tax=Rhodocytophaga rosea TaxID=2704465 RepID=A0A6C0GBI7_9BACT|nr:GNAT family N-acetyltransferase [Rhodocytophaga rosea]QHT65248.1 GNAT family N-acetyltransferase [Rhodocytophaga rosea]
MQNQEFYIKPYETNFKEQILSVWEKSVRATHNFVKPSDIDYYKQSVKEIDFCSLSVYCLTNENKVVGFIGVADLKIEMLFLDPDYIGQGLGKKLMNFALNDLKADQVDVNEQNSNAVKFYSKFGFTPYEKTEKDREGKDYPILKMKLKFIDTNISLNR